MPRRIDVSRSRAQVNNNPNTTISAASIQGILQQTAYLPAVTLEALENIVTNLLTLIDDVTGLNLIGLANALKDLFGTGQDLLLALLDNIPLIGPIIAAITGTSPSGEFGAALNLFIQFLKDIISIIGDPLDLGSGNPIIAALENIPLLRPLIEMLNSALGNLATAGVDALISTLQFI